MVRSTDYWLWCGHCRRCYMRSEVVRHRSGCPYPRCWGTLLRDGFVWEDVRTLKPGVTYPETPEYSTVYDIPEDRLWVLVEPRSA